MTKQFTYINPNLYGGVVYLKAPDNLCEDYHQLEPEHRLDFIDTLLVSIIDYLSPSYRFASYLSQWERRIHHDEGYLNRNAMMMQVNYNFERLFRPILEENRLNYLDKIENVLFDGCFVFIKW